MDQQNAAQVTAEQARQDLALAKERLSGQGESLSLREYMGKHPYVTLGAAFFSGVLLGGSKDILEEMAKAAAETVTKAVIEQHK